MKTRPLLTWTLYLCLILLWGFDTVEFKQGSLSVGFKWDFRNNGFRDAGHFASITAIMWVLSTVLMFYYVKYQVSKMSTMCTVIKFQSRQLSIGRRTGAVST